MVHVVKLLETCATPRYPLPMTVPALAQSTPWKVTSKLPSAFFSTMSGVPSSKMPEGLSWLQTPLFSKTGLFGFLVHVETGFIPVFEA